MQSKSVRSRTEVNQRARQRKKLAEEAETEVIKKGNQKRRSLWKPSSRPYWMGNREPLKGLKQWQDTFVLESSGWREEEWALLPKQVRRR